MALVLASITCFCLGACSYTPSDPPVREPIRLTSDTLEWNAEAVLQSPDAEFAFSQAVPQPYETRYYYQQLSAADQVHYRAMYNTLAAHASVARLSGAYDDHLQDIARCVFLDNPEFFYATQGGTYYGWTQSTEYEISYNTNTPEAFTHRALIDAWASEALQASEQAETDREKLYALCLWLAQHITYDYAAAELSDEEFYATSVHSNTLRGAFEDGLAICGGYATAFYYLCDKLGIPCIYVEGNVDTGQFAGAHAWDLVYDGQQWLCVDPTWCDLGDAPWIDTDNFLVPTSYHDLVVTDYLVPAELPSS